MSNNNTPPLLSKSTTYDDWKKKLLIWSDFTTLETTKHGAAVLLTLEGAAVEAVLELERATINSEESLKKITERLDILYLKDSTLEKFQALECFETYKTKFSCHHPTTHSPI